MMFLLSDFRHLNEAVERHLKQLASHGDLFLMHISDPVEAELPAPGRYRILMGGRSFTIDTSDERIRDRYRRRFESTREKLRSLGRLAGITVIECSTLDDPHAVLARRFAGT
jgi:hypothetical protein